MVCVSLLEFLRHDILTEALILDVHHRIMKIGIEFLTYSLYGLNDYIADRFQDLRTAEKDDYAGFRGCGIFSSSPEYRKSISLAEDDR